MTITTVDGFIAGLKQPRHFQKGLTGTMVAGRAFSFWGSNGVPGPGAYDTTLNGVVLSSTSAMVNGQLPFIDPGSGNTHLARFVAGHSAVGGCALLCDRLWHNGGFTITSTSPQTLTSPTWPNRCPTSMIDETPSTNGESVQICVEVSATTSTNAPTLTVGYTNQSGTSSRTGVNIQTTAANALLGSTYPIGLQAGDTGVRSIESLTLSASWTSGTINLVAYRVLGVVDLNASGMFNCIDFLTGGFARMYNGCVPYFMLIPSATTTGIFHGSVALAQG